MALNDRNQVAVSTSHTYDDITAANAAHPIATKEQTFHTVYNLSSGKEIQAHKSLFKHVYKRVSGWDAQNIGGYVFIQDLESRLWGVYQSGGGKLAADQTGLELGSTFLGYRAVNHTAYFLIVNKGTGAPTIKALTIPSMLLTAALTVI
jgi:hypothetical protein